MPTGLFRTGVRHGSLLMAVALVLSTASLVKLLWAIDDVPPRKALILGDSFLQGWDFEPHLKSQLISHLEKNGVEPTIEKFVGGGLFNYEHAARTLIPKLDPDLVIVFYFVGNGLTTVQHRAPRFNREIDAGCVPEAVRGRRPSPRDFDWEEMAERGMNPDLLALGKRSVTRRRAGQEPINPYFFWIALHSPRFVLDNLLMDTPCNQAAWQISTELFSSIVDSSNDAGADLFVVAIPDMAQVNPSAIEFYKGLTFEVNEEVPDSRRPQELLAKLAEDLGFTVIDLLPTLASHPDPVSLHWRYDAHWTPAGHQVAFEVIRETLLDPWVHELQVLGSAQQQLPVFASHQHRIFDSPSIAKSSI